jgi:hypothetical protein
VLLILITQKIQKIIITERNVKPLVPDLFAIVSTPTNPHWARVVSYGPYSSCVIHKEGLCLSSGDNNSLMMIMMIKLGKVIKKIN